MSLPLSPKPTITGKSRSVMPVKQMMQERGKGQYAKRWKDIIKSHKTSFFIEISGGYMDEKLLEMARNFGDALSLSTLVAPLRVGDGSSKLVLEETEKKLNNIMGPNEKFVSQVSDGNLRMTLTNFCNLNGGDLLLLSDDVKEQPKRRSGGSAFGAPGGKQAASSEPVWKTIRRCAGSILVAKSACVHKRRADLQDGLNYTCYVNGTPAGDCTYKLVKKIMKPEDKIHLVQIVDRFNSIDYNHQEKLEANYNRFIDACNAKVEDQADYTRIDARKDVVTELVTFATAKKSHIIVTGVDGLEAYMNEKRDPFSVVDRVMEKAAEMHVIVAKPQYMQLVLQSAHRKMKQAQQQKKRRSA